MPELPDVVVVVEKLQALLAGHTLLGVRLASPFLLRSVIPPLSAVVGKQVNATRRIGKRVVIDLDDDLFLVIHLMIAGRLQWRDKGAKIPGKIGVAAFDFDHGTLTFTEASPKKRASLHVVQTHEALAEHDPGGVDVFTVSEAEFATLLRAERHTLKRVLTDPRTFSGIGNAYSDEILHHARLSPVAMSTSLDDDDAASLLASTRAVLQRFTDLLRADTSTPLGPEKMTAFRPEMAVHGKANEPCPRCGAPVQRIAYADNETNYCAPCQTNGRLLADRALSRLLKDDFPRTLDDLEALKKEHRAKAPSSSPSSSSLKPK
ncbi:MAG: DNA-formamidopyrimidine glycosylase family protein [Deltaproteobacteria bacterium]|nr:DNA-formamidopyrimidine glycosylase family protein [Deltaproteobacteria bacterium]